MRNLVAFFVKYPIWANAIIFIALVGGAGAYVLNLKTSFFPESPPKNITITVNFPGASPEEMEEGVTIKVEEAIKGIEGIDEVTSVSSENTANISIRIREGYDLDEVTTEVKNAVDRINSFPVAAEKPIVFKEKSTSGAAFLVLKGDVSLMALKEAAQLIEDDFLNSGEISQVRLSGFPDLEISIEVSEDDLRRYDLTFDDLAVAVRTNNLDVSGGTIKTSEEEIRIRANAKKFDPSVIEEIIVRANPDGSKLLLKDVAEVQMKFADTPNKFYSDGQRAVRISVSKLPEEDIQKISAFIDDYVKDYNAKSSNLELFTDFDFNSVLQDRLDLLTKNFGAGLFLVLFTLGLFLSLRLSFWVAAGIPISFCGMFILGNIAGITINMLTLTGMLLVVGILVDDGIVIAENIYTHFQKGKSPQKAAIDGTMEVLPSVFISVTTTIVAFLPLIFLDNNGFTKEMAIVVMACLAFSLIEAFFVLPAHLAHKWVLSRKDGHGWYHRFRRAMEDFINYLRYKVYGPAISFLLNWRWVSFMAPLVFIMIIWGMLQGGVIKFTPFSRPPVDNINVDLQLKPGTRENIVEDYLKKFENQIRDMHQRMITDGEISDTIISSIDIALGVTSDRSYNGSNVGYIQVEFDNLDDEGISGLQVASFIRKELGIVPEAEKFTVGSANYWGKPVSISLKSKDIDDLENAKEELKAKLSNLPDLRDIVDNAAVGQRELKLELKPLAYHLGLTHQDITNQVRQGFFGEEVQRLQMGTDEVRVWVRYPEEDRLTISQLESMKIKLPGNVEYPLYELADYEIERGIININHFNGKREIRVDAELQTVKTPLPPLLDKIKTDIIPPLLAKYPGLAYTFEGQSRGQQRQMDSFFKVIGPVILLMILLITLNFRSVYQTSLILFLLPLGWACSVFGHWFHDSLVSFVSIYGMMALSGVIINDAVVMLDRFNKNLKEKMSIFYAAKDAGIARFRAILLTSLTTVAGLYPLILEKSFQAQFIIPMAISLAYGVLFGTLFILFFFPVMILVFNDIRVYVIYLIRLLRGFISWATGSDYQPVKPGREEVEPVMIESERISQL
ncbi:MAG TPA: efflux RND transporter permease subunit [Cyclobacteriaceae bacterium]